MWSVSVDVSDVEVDGQWGLTRQAGDIQQGMTSLHFNDLAQKIPGFFSTPL